MSKDPRILIYGYGNPGRQDDGLGPELVSRLENWLKDNGIKCVTTDSNYQLNIEDASVISDKDLVIFVDATLNDIQSYQLNRLEPSAKVEFTMHAVSPAFVLDLCQSLYNRIPESYLLQIRGYEWKFLEKMTPEAINNLEQAFAFLKEYISEQILSVCEKT